MKGFVDGADDRGALPQHARREAVATEACPVLPAAATRRETVLQPDDPLRKNEALRQRRGPLLEDLGARAPPRPDRTFHPSLRRRVARHG